MSMKLSGLVRATPLSAVFSVFLGILTKQSPAFCEAHHTRNREKSLQGCVYPSDSESRTPIVDIFLLV